MHLHILGICGTFMGGLALLARAAGHEVTGSDQNVYPPMSDQLRAAGISVIEGFDPSQFASRPDLVVMGNAMSRGNPAVEWVLNNGLAYTSGPEWLARAILQDRWVLAVSGTHGKTTTSAMLAWILESAGLSPGYLIGGVAQNFADTARIGNAPFFVIEADEYDTAFFDKRSKFVHYRPRTLVINNLEFDHADIFDDLAAIQKQFHHLLRTVPADGLVIWPKENAAVEQVLAQGCWSQTQTVGTEAADWWMETVSADGRELRLHHQHQHVDLHWGLLGQHNAQNACAAIAAAHHVGVPVAVAVAALRTFKGVKRRLELRAEQDNIRLYDDFAHHPTAIASTLQGLRARAEARRIIAIVEPRSNTMKMGVHQAQLAEALNQADAVVMFQSPELTWSVDALLQTLKVPAQGFHELEALVAYLADTARAGDDWVVMSNGGFGGLHQRLSAVLAARNAGDDARPSA